MSVPHQTAKKQWVDLTHPCRRFAHHRVGHHCLQFVGEGVLFDENGFVPAVVVFAPRVVDGALEISIVRS